MTPHRKRGRSSPQRTVKVHGDLDPRHWRMKKLLPWRCYMGDNRCGGRRMSVAYPGRTLPLRYRCGCSLSNLLLVAFGIPSSSYRTLSVGYKVSYMIAYRTSSAVPVPALRADANSMAAAAHLVEQILLSRAGAESSGSLSEISCFYNNFASSHPHPAYHWHGLSSASTTTDRLVL